MPKTHLKIQLVAQGTEGPVLGTFYVAAEGATSRITVEFYQTEVQPLVDALIAAEPEKEENKPGAPYAVLSDTERGVLQGILEGLDNRKVAQQLSLSEQRTSSAARALFDKFGVKNRAELMLLKGEFDPEDQKRRIAAYLLDQGASLLEQGAYVANKDIAAETQIIVPLVGYHMKNFRKAAQACGLTLPDFLRRQVKVWEAERIESYVVSESVATEPSMPWGKGGQRAGRAVTFKIPMPEYDK